MLATISPASLHLDETLATLRYACQARTIVNRVRVNEDPNGRRIRELHAEIERLQVQAQDFERQKRCSNIVALQQPRKIIIETTTAVDEAELVALRGQLAESAEQLLAVRAELAESLDRQQAMRLLLDEAREELLLVRGPAPTGGGDRAELKTMRFHGLALRVAIAQNKACLVNLRPDPMRDGVVLFVLPLGLVRVGRKRPPGLQNLDIELDGVGVAFNHCLIENLRGDLYIEPQTTEFDTFLNGDAITERTRLFNGDRLVIGESHFLRVSNPHCSHRHSDPTDQERAYTEVLQQETQRLRAQVDAERAANDMLYRERLATVQQFREIVESERLALALERRQPNATAGETTDTTSARALSAAVVANAQRSDPLLEMIRGMVTRPSDEEIRWNDAQIALARQRCVELCGVLQPERYEFAQRLVSAGHGMLEAVVTIVDTERPHLIAEWPPKRLEIWLERMRDVRPESCAAGLFAGFDVVWRNADEYARSRAEQVQEIAAATATAEHRSPRVSLVGGALKTFRHMFGAQSPAKQDADKSGDLSKKRLQYDATPAPKRHAENVRPAVDGNTEDKDSTSPTTTTTTTTTKRSLKLVSMVVD